VMVRKSSDKVDTGIEMIGKFRVSSRTPHLPGDCCYGCEGTIIQAAHPLKQLVLLIIIVLNDAEAVSP